MIRHSLPLAALALALAACGEAETAPTDEATSGEQQAPAADRFEGTKLVVNANGVAGASADSAMVLRFGSPRADVEKLAESAWGTAGETSRQEECGAGPMDFVSYGPLQLAFQDDKFSGWFLQTGEGVATSDGIRPGVTIDALKSERQVREIESTLPGEFEYTTGDFGTIRGFSEQGTITGLQAGLSCFFR
ncbi:hypothetical protein GRI42_03070 [Erythrobacter gaetbuli]|uniref:Aspartate-semialdehyde dehydrogenase n=1 Tax=Qipengyuania gaetbuli TaxID=266952 RepID=A0A844XWN8_9SPHN|nr:hypothetical protein [Qipengyuania gaetbuli]MXO50281.1 hypothetical protein [Qipengyuania gaetbuli]